MTISAAVAAALQDILQRISCKDLNGAIYAIELLALGHIRTIIKPGYGPAGTAFQSAAPSYVLGVEAARAATDVLSLLGKASIALRTGNLSASSAAIWAAIERWRHGGIEIGAPLPTDQHSINAEAYSTKQAGLD